MPIKELSDYGPDGARVGQAAADKVSFHGATPVVQVTGLVAPVGTASTTGSYGFTQAQADALITYVRGLDAALKAKGLIG